MPYDKKGYLNVTTVYTDFNFKPAYIDYKLDFYLLDLLDLILISEVTISNYY